MMRIKLVGIERSHCYECEGLMSLLGTQSDWHDVTEDEYEALRSCSSYNRDYIILVDTPVNFDKFLKKALDEKDKIARAEERRLKEQKKAAEKKEKSRAERERKQYEKLRQKFEK